MDETNDFLPSANQGHEDHEAPASDHEAPASDHEAPASDPNSELQPLPEQPPKKSKFKIIAAAVIALVALAAGAFYFMQSATADDAPPSVEFNTDALKQGFLKDGMLSSATFEQKDKDDFLALYPAETVPNAILQNAGWHYVYSTAEVSFEDIAKSISPEAEQIAISYWSPTAKNFKIWPAEASLSYVIRDENNLKVPTIAITDAQAATEKIPAMRGYSVLIKNNAGVYGTIQSPSDWGTETLEYPMKGLQSGWNLTAAPKNLHSLVKGHSGKIQYIYEFKDGGFSKIYNSSFNDIADIKDHELTSSLVWLKLNADITAEVVDPDEPVIEKTEVTLSTSAGQKPAIPGEAGKPIVAGETLEVFVMDLAYEGVLELTDMTLTRVGTPATEEEVAEMKLYLISGTEETAIGLEMAQFDEMPLTFGSPKVMLPEGGATLALSIKMADALVGGGAFHYEIKAGDITLKGEKEIEFKDTTFPIKGTVISTGEAAVPESITISAFAGVNNDSVSPGSTDVVFAGGNILPTEDVKFLGGKLFIESSYEDLTTVFKEIAFYVGETKALSWVESDIATMTNDENGDTFNFEALESFTLSAGGNIPAKETPTPIKVVVTLKDDVAVGSDSFIGMEIKLPKFEPEITNTGAFSPKSSKDVVEAAGGDTATITMGDNGITSPVMIEAGALSIPIYNATITSTEVAEIKALTVDFEDIFIKSFDKLQFYLGTGLLAEMDAQDIAAHTVGVFENLPAVAGASFKINAGQAKSFSIVAYAKTEGDGFDTEGMVDTGAKISFKLGFDGDTGFDPEKVYESSLMKTEEVVVLPVSAVVTASADVNNAAVEQGELNVVFAGGNIAVDKPVNINEITLEFESNNVKISTILTGARVHINGKVVKGMLPVDLDGLKGINALDEENYRYEFVFPVEGTDGLLEGASNEVKVTANIQDTVTANQLIGIKISDIGFDKEVVVKEGTLATAMKKTLAVVPEPGDPLPDPGAGADPLDPAVLLRQVSIVEGLAEYIGALKNAALEDMLKDGDMILVEVPDSPIDPPVDPAVHGQIYDIDGARGGLVGNYIYLSKEGVSKLTGETVTRNFVGLPLDLYFDVLSDGATSKAAPKATISGDAVILKKSVLNSGISGKYVPTGEYTKSGLDDLL